MSNDQFADKRSSTQFNDGDDAFILVQTENISGLLKFDSLTVSNSDDPSSPTYVAVQIPLESLVVTYWPNLPYKFGISFKMFSWENSSAFNNVFISISSTYEPQQSMDAETPERYDLKNIIHLSRYGTGENSSAGSSLFSLNKVLFTSLALVSITLYRLV